MICDPATLRALAERSCQNCDGSGWLLLDVSWFKADGHRRERCGICAGTGRDNSGFKPSVAFRKHQARARAAEMEASNG